MRILSIAILILTTTSSFAQNNRIEEVGKSPVEVEFSPNGQIHADLCSSGAVIKGTDEHKLRVSYDSESGRTADVRVRLRTASNRADLAITGCSHKNFELTIEVPKYSDLYVDMFAGELEVRNVIGHKDMNLDTGQLILEIGDPSNYAHVDASVTTGELDAAPFDISKAGLFRSFHRDGPGKYRLRAHVGAGELDLR